MKKKFITAGGAFGGIRLLSGLPFLTVT